MELDTKIWFMPYLQQKEKSFSIYYIDETVIQIGDHHYWLWICVEPIHKSVLGINISGAERNMFVAENFIRSLVDKYGRHTVYTDMVVLGTQRHVLFYI